MPVSNDDLAVDGALADICGQVPLLLLTTPTNVTEQWARFAAGARRPEFVYRPLPDLGAIAKQLEGVDPERATDPIVRQFALKKKRELELRLEMLKGRCSERFFLASVELFGHVEDPVHQLAMDLLATSPPPSVVHPTVGATEFAAAARVEVARYRDAYPELAARVIVSDIVAGVMVENGDLYVGSDTRIATDRVVHLLHHEVGVHVLTYANGCAQPLRLLAVGLAGYDESQEALGVLAEHLSGGLGPGRLHTLALRVVAARLRSENTPFADTVDHLVDLGARPRPAFITAMRAYRSGGMTKDALYLRGLVRLFDHLARGGSLTRMLVGKITLDDESLVGELVERDVLREPPLRPRFLEDEQGRRRLAAIRGGITVRDLGAVAA